MINYWKLYEDIRREGKEKKKKLFVNRNVKQCGAQVLVKGWAPWEPYPTEKTHNNSWTELELEIFSLQTM